VVIRDGTPVGLFSFALKNSAPVAHRMEALTRSPSPQWSVGCGARESSATKPLPVVFNLPLKWSI
jgi:hypothetical protein